MTSLVGHIEFVACRAPDNDDFADAIQILGAEGETEPVIIDCATTEVDEPSGTNLFDPPTHKTIWYVWVCPATDNYTFDTHLSTGDPTSIDTFGALDTNMAVWTGVALNALSEVASNDDMDQLGADIHWWSLVDFAATEGVTYYIQIGVFTDLHNGVVILNWALS